MRPAGLVLLAAVVAWTGCTMSASSRRTLMVGGAALGLGGVLVVRSGSVDSDHDGTNETWLNDDLGDYAAGSLMVVAGAVMLLGALASTEPSAEISAPPVAAPTTSSITPQAPELPADEATADGAPTVAEPAPRTITIERAPAIPLPELPTTEAAERLARQLRSASAHGHCEVAWIMWADLEKHDPVYARAVRDGPVMARCAE